VVTKVGRPFVEIVPVQNTFGVDSEKAALFRRVLGIDGLQVGLAADFDDPGFSRRVLGLEC